MVMCVTCVTVLVSSMCTFAPMAHICIQSHHASTQEVNVQNAAAWTSLAQQPDGPVDKGEDGGNAQEDELWKEFASREQQQQQVVRLVDCHC